MNLAVPRTFRHVKQVQQAASIHADLHALVTSPENSSSRNWLGAGQLERSKRVLLPEPQSQL